MPGVGNAPAGDTPGPLQPTLPVNRMKLPVRLFLMLAMVLPGLALAAKPGGITVKVDPRVELVTVMARLAGFEEYQAPGIASYDEAVKQHFARFSAHPSIALLRQLRDQRGIAYNAPIELALAADPGNWKPQVKLSPWPDFLDKRWDAASARSFLAAAGRFERDTGAKAFFASQQPLYDQVKAAVAGNLSRRLETDWYRVQMPERRITRFTVIPALLAGPNSYGPHLRYLDGHEEVFGVLATPAHHAGEAIEYPADPQLSLLVHEFHHSYMNPWADQQAAVLMPAAEQLFTAVQARMKELAYGEARIMLYESLVRANTIRYLRRHSEDAVLARVMSEDQDKGFPWTPALADLLDSLDHGQGPAFDAGTARSIAAFLNDWGRDNGARVVAEQERLAAVAKARLAQGPQILKFVPAQDATVGTDVQLLEVHFDRAMAPSLAIFGDTPEIAGKPSWDETRRILRLPVKLSPGARYHLYFNGGDSTKMQSADGETLVPREWRFQVREAGS